MLSEFKDCGMYRRAKLNGYTSQMARKSTKPVYDDRVASILKEQGFIWTDDDSSYYDPELLFEALERYSPSKDTFIDKNDAHLQAGMKMAYKVFARRKHLPTLKPLRTESELFSAMNPGTSAGLPMLGNKKDDFWYAIDREQQVMLGKKAPAPCLAGKRSQSGKKVRLVWMYPMEMTLMESRFARPLINEFLISRTTMAFGMMKWELGALVDSISNEMGGETVAMDYSKFDSTISSYLIRQAFGILATWFDPKDLEKYGWNQIINYFIYTPIVMPDGHLYKGKNHGVPSGSYFTQLIDSIVNTILIGAMSHKFKLGVTWTKFLVLGDDVIISFDNARKLMPDIALFMRELGIIMNMEKQEFGPHFLGANWYHGKPFRDFEQLKSKAVYPESFRNYKTDKSDTSGPWNVLYSYATQYYNAWKLLQRDWRPYDWDQRAGSDKYLTGLARYNKSMGFNDLGTKVRPTLTERSIV